MFETLRNFAEVGVAIAGFSAIAVALNRDLTIAPVSKQRGGLLTLLETAGLVVLFALLPQILEPAPIGEATRWRAALLVYGTTHLIHAWIVSTRQQARQSIVPFAGGLIVGGVAILIAQFAVGVWGGLDWVRLVYLAALGWHALVAAISFAGLILSDPNEEA